ncbi:vesicular inhibitory amino acid transporter-like [Saccostrea echinata]|uniref:vesicular inhibitory amino acid transporter-like n=1 Tax=Saccostrea echinata TaxID=191078 RepID=UPI002A7FAB9D|nr:vesicular inhibitory amino acid transporter-like [Saccostrea echinata]
MAWFRQRQADSYSTLKEESAIEMKRHGEQFDKNNRRNSLQEIQEICTEDSSYYGTLENEKIVNVSEEKLTTLQAAWNIINMIQGNVILNSPYVLLVGGVPGIVLTILVGYISVHTCRLLIDCQYDEDELGNKSKTRHTMHDIAVHNLGKRAGVLLIDVLQIMLMFGNCVFQLLFCGQMIYPLFPGNPFGFNGIILLFSLAMFPFAFVKSIKTVSYFSCASVVVTSLSYVGLISYMFSKIDKWVMEEFPLTTNIYQSSVSLGMIVFGFDSQLYVNSLDSKLKEGSNIKKMIAYTHVMSVLLKIFFGLVGIFTFGQLTRETITNNIDIVPLKYFFNILYPLKFFLIFQFPYFAIVDLIQEKLFQGVNITRFPSCLDEENSLKWWAIILRLSLVLMIVIVCLIFPDVAILTSYTGSTVGAFIMFLLPVYFHLNMYWRKMHWYHILHDYFVLLAGVIVVFCGIFSFVQREIVTRM